MVARHSRQHGTPNYKLELTRGLNFPYLPPQPKAKHCTLTACELDCSVSLKDWGIRSMFLSTQPFTVYFTFPA